MTKQEIAKKLNEEQERMTAGYKTGYFFGTRKQEQQELAEKHGCDCLGAGVVEIDWYLTRNAERKPVIRVKWHFPTRASRKVYDKCGYSYYKKTWQCTTKEQKYPFSVEGLEAAFKLVESL